MRVHAPPSRRWCWPHADRTLHRRAAPRSPHRGTPSPCSLMSPLTSPRRGCAPPRAHPSGRPAVMRQRRSRPVRGVRVHRHLRLHLRGPRRPPRRGRQLQRHRPPRQSLRRLLVQRHRPPRQSHRRLRLQRQCHPLARRSTRCLPPQCLQCRPLPHRVLARPRPAQTRARTGASRSPHSRATGTVRLRIRRAPASHASTWSSRTRT